MDSIKCTHTGAWAPRGSETERDVQARRLTEMGGSVSDWNEVAARMIADGKAPAEAEADAFVEVMTRAKIGYYERKRRANP